MPVMRRRLSITVAVTAAGLALLWQTGYVAPLLYGIHRWVDARPSTEADPIG